MNESSIDTSVQRWRKYPAYNRSGFDWLGDVPAHWKVSRVKRYSKRIQSGGTPPTADQQYYEAEEIPWYAPGSFGTDLQLTKPAKFIAAVAVRDGVARLFPAGSTMLVTIGATIGKVGYIEEDASSNQQITAISFDNCSIFPKFAAYQLKRLEPVLQGISPGTTLPILDQQEVGHLPFTVPPLSEQRQISAFLDFKTSQIDALIGHKERLIALLEEKRQAVISHAVTRGLDPAAPLKDSGVPWLGMVPKHWRTLALRRAVTKFVDYRGATPKKVDVGVRLVTASNVHNGAIDYGVSEDFISEEDYLPWMVRGFPAVGDVLLTTEAPLGETAMVDNDKIALAQRVILFKVNHARMTNEYLCLYFQSAAGKGELWSRSTGSTAIGIKASHLKGIPVIVPPLPEQQAITDHVSCVTSRVKAAMGPIREGIARLQEYRTALISAVVTGQIDVRGEVIP
jgi:type I restriction enzyme S subunit